MKQFLFLTFFSVVLVQLSFAGPCTSTNLANYISLGPAGCTFDGYTLANFQALPGTPGYTEIANSAVNITPVGGAFNPGITASVTETVAAPANDEINFAYTISGANFRSETIILSGTSETGDGGVTDIQNYCEGGTFGPGGINGCPTLLTVDGVQNQDSVNFGLPTLLTVADDLVISGGVSGSATAGDITDQFTTVPEPASPLITGAGLLCFAWSRLRRRSTTVSEEGVNQ